MNAVYEWLDERHNILIIRYLKGITWTQFHAVFGTLGEDEHFNGQRMCVIHIVEQLPTGAILPHVRTIQKQTPDFIIFGVVVPASNRITNAVITTLLNVIAGVGMKGAVKVATTREEAIGWCEEYLQQQTNS